jgi:hypothetical protein
MWNGGGKIGGNGMVELWGNERRRGRRWGWGRGEGLVRKT